MHSQLEEIYKTYFHDVYRYALSLCQNESQAQDLVSETYLKAIQALPEDYMEVRAWLFRVCRNCFIDQQRKKKRWRMLSLEHVQGWLTTQEDGASIAFQQQEKEQLHLLILQLKQPYREVLLLYYLAQYSIQETAQILHIQEGSVKTRLHRGRELLRIQLEEERDAYETDR